MEHKSRNFDKREDELLLEMVRKYGADSWPTIAATLGSRTPRQCRNRYTQFLDPSLNTSPWTTEEDELLKKQYEEIGPRWASMRYYFPGRTDLSIKNRFGYLARNHPDVNSLKTKYTAEPRTEEATEDVAEGSPPADRAAPPLLACRSMEIDTLFQTLPYYVKRSVFLESILREHGIEVPREGICEASSWIATDNNVTQQSEVADSEALSAIQAVQNPEKDES